MVEVTERQPGLGAERARTDYVGTLIGESTSREFRLAVAREAIREQDIIAVDVTLRPTEGDGQVEQLRLWAKVQRIERINPLFPVESGHELAETRTNPLDTVLSLSREMVTAVCLVLGSEPLEGAMGGRLDHVRYPPQPATQAYRPRMEDVQRVVLGELGQQANRALDLATLSNRPSVGVSVNGHAIVTRHLAILAMTGAGKSVTARRIVEELARKNYPIVIFDPHGDYTGLADVAALRGKVRRYYAQLPVFDEEPEKVIEIIESLAWKLSDNQRLQFDDLFRGATEFLRAERQQLEQRRDWLASYLGNPKISQFGLRPNLYFLADFVQAIVRAGKDGDQASLSQLSTWSGCNYTPTITRQVAGWIEGLVGRLRTAAKTIRRMETISRRIAREAEPLPTERTELVRYGQVSVVSLAGYTGDFQATIYSLIAGDIFDAKVRNDLRLPVLFVLEEAHNFAPARANTPAEEGSIVTTKQIAQEGRKFGVGLILISQRPSRLDETTLAMCNSYIIMRMVNPTDQGFVRRVVESLGEDDAAMLPDLDVGEAILSGQLINFPVLVRIKQPVSEGEHEERDAFEVLEAVQQEVKDERRGAS
jgi:DNA helicase HerA-like ATPase